MEAIKKLKIVFKVAMLSILIPLFLAIFKNNISLGITYAIILIIFVLVRLTFFRNKKTDYENYNMVSPYYVYGGIFLFFAIIASFATISDLIQKAPIPLWAIVVLSGAWIFGILLIFYSYQTKKESSLKSTLVEKTKKKIEREKIKI